MTDLTQILGSEWYPTLPIATLPSEPLTSAPLPIDYALHYISQGLTPIPLYGVVDGKCTCKRGAECTSSGKHPRVLRPAAIDATEEQWQKWCSKWPDMNIGILTGEDTGIFVVDIDPRHGGDISLATLFSDHGTFPETLSALTGGGGTHYLFSTPAGATVRNSASNLGEGIDIRGNGGLIVVEPSATTGSYKWQGQSLPTRDQIAPPPGWLPTLINAPAPKVTPTPTAPLPLNAVAESSPGFQTPDDTVGEGGRNNFLASAAGWYQSQGIRGGLLLDVLRMVNTTKCFPPLDDDEVKKVASSIDRYGECTAHRTLEFPAPEPITASEWHDARPTPDCIVEDYLFADVAVFIAPGGMGKTTLKLFEAIHIAIGRPLYGAQIFKPGSVLIITAEDSREMLIARLRTIAQEMNLGNAATELVRQKIHIADTSGSGFRLTEIGNDSVRPAAELDQVIEACRKIKPVLIIVDPAVSFGVGESRVNDAEQGLIEAARRLRRELNCCVQYIHHSGKQNAREKAVDQYAGRGGSAFADGARMVHVLQSLTASEWRSATGQELAEGETGLRLARPKMSYCAPQPDILIRRKGYLFQHVEAQVSSKREKLESAAVLVWELLNVEVMQGCYPSRNTLEHLDHDLKRGELRAAISLLLEDGRIEERQVPSGGKGGTRKYLHPLVRQNETANPPQKMPENEGSFADEKPVFASPPPLGNSPAANLPPPDEPSFSYGSPNIDGEPMANLANQWG